MSLKDAGFDQSVIVAYSQSVTCIKHPSAETLPSIESSSTNCQRSADTMRTRHASKCQGCFTPATANYTSQKNVSPGLLQAMHTTVTPKQKIIALSEKL